MKVDIFDCVLGKWRKTRQKGWCSTGNAWLHIKRAYIEEKKEECFISLREINKSWGGKPRILSRHKLKDATMPLTTDDQMNKK
jgi:hypothetical protein